jgi:hypothetical protein
VLRRRVRLRSLIAPNVAVRFDGNHPEACGVALPYARAVDAHALDFWLGDWRCAWSDGSGTNVVTREFDGRVVVERFRAHEPETFDGMSVSVFDDATGWRQTWVDSAGGYWHLVGSPLPDGSVGFATPGRVDAEQLFKRMVFTNVAADRFDWRWESSDDGEHWHERWAIRYSRSA